MVRGHRCLVGGDRVRIIGSLFIFGGACLSPREGFDVDLGLGRWCDAATEHLLEFLSAPFFFVISVLEAYCNHVL